MATKRIEQLTRQETAEYLRVSVGFVDKMARQKRLVKVKLGRRTVFRITDIERLLERSRG